MKLKLSNGAEVEIIDNSGSSGEYFGSTTAALKSFQESFLPVIGFANDVLTSLKAGISPKELEITFSAEAGGEGGVFGIARAHAKGTIEIKMKWTS